MYFGHKSTGIAYSYWYTGEIYQFKHGNEKKLKGKADKHKWGKGDTVKVDVDTHKWVITFSKIKEGSKEVMKVASVVVPKGQNYHMALSCYVKSGAVNEYLLRNDL